MIRLLLGVILIVAFSFTQSDELLIKIIILYIS